MLTFFPDDPIYPPGFAYHPGFITPEEEEIYLALILQIELHPFEFQGFEARRRVASFGYDYRFDRGSLEKGVAIPDAFQPLIGKVAQLLQIDPARFVELLVTEYPPGSIITWHRDAPPFDLIAGVSLGADCKFRLRPYDKAKQGRGSIVDVVAQRRSLYVMQGPARSDWQHAIAPVSKTRYSITLRTLRESGPGTA